MGTPLPRRPMFAGLDHKPQTRTWGATAATIVLHGLVILGIVVVFTHRDDIRQVVTDRAPLSFAFLQQAGPGGGGGGSPAPVPPRTISVPRTPPPPTPDLITPSTTPPSPVPMLSAPVMTTSHDLAQAVGASSASLADVGGGGHGGGLGPGDGAGVGDGRTQGFGGDRYRPGTGIQNPTVVKEVRPAYTSEAMRAKIQGNVRLEAVVDENGSVSDVRVIRSLDKQYGLDQQAMNAARLWIFRPARDRNNRPVPVVIEFDLAFALH
jgi:protein TonB